MRLTIVSTAALECLLAVLFWVPSVQPKGGAEPKASSVPSIKFPDVLDVGPKPTPVNPSAAVKLTADTVYVVQSDTPFLLFDSPPGRVVITREAGPLRFRGKFIDGNGKVETRTLAGKHLAIVEAASSGSVELIAVPAGADTEAAATRKTIDVEAQGPRPPPDDEKEVIPDPKPKPPPIDPKPEPTDLITGPVWLVTVTGPERSITAAKLVNDTAYWKSLEAAGHKFRHYSPTDASAIASGYAKIHAALGDCLVIAKLDGTLIRKIALPPLTTDVTALLKATVKP